jgi:uncharacterized membrane protein YfcA
MHHFLTYFVLFILALIAGMINSVAGGGTILTFPALIAAGIPPTVANATNTVALVPASISAFWSYRGEIEKDRKQLWWMGLPSLVGGVVGAIILLRVSESLFSHLVPWLILSATALFMIQEPISRYVARRKGGDVSISQNAPSSGSLVAIVIVQFLVAVYGGFFGAGIGIIMLSALGFFGIRNIHHANALKNFAAACINGVATITFMVGRHIDWPIGLVMACGAILGGFGGAGIAQKIGEANVRRVIMAIGCLITAYMFYRQVSHHSL